MAWVFLLVLLLLVSCFMPGCAALDALVITEPGGGPSVVDTISSTTITGGAVATAFGMPWGILLSSIGSGAAGIAAAYTQMRKKQRLVQRENIELDIILHEIVAGVESYKGSSTAEDKDRLRKALSKRMSETAKERVTDIKAGNY